MNIVKEAQNARAVGGPRGKGVGVQQVVAAPKRQVAALLFLGTEAGVVQLPVLLVGRQKFAEKPHHGRGVAAHDLL